MESVAKSTSLQPEFKKEMELFASLFQTFKPPGTGEARRLGRLVDVSPIDSCNWILPADHALFLDIFPLQIRCENVKTCRKAGKN